MDSKINNLKADLSDYLSRNKPKNGISITVPIPEFSKLFDNQNFDIKGLLGTSTSNQTASTSTVLCPSLTRFQRFFGFLVCILLSIFFYTLSAFYIPLLVLKARKFALLYTLGSASFFASFVFLRGPVTFLKQLLSKSQWIFVIVFVSAFAATLYFAVWEHDTLLTIVFAVVQSLSLLHYFFSFAFSSCTGVNFFSRIFARTVGSTVTATVGSAINATVNTTAATRNYICDFV